jgi:heat shock protein HslJ
MRSRILASILLTPAFLSACADPEKERQPVADSRPYAEAVRQAEKDWVWIAGTEWVLVSIEGQPPLEGARSTLSFKPDETWMFGSTGCNRFTGSYIRRGVDGVEVGPLAVTKMFCSQPEGVMQQEARLLHLLDMADSYTASRDRFSLEVDGSTVLVYYASPKP